MQLSALLLLTIAAVGGVALSLADAVPKPMRIGHGVVAGIGLVLLLIAALIANESLMWTAFGLIAIGFAVGAVLFGVVFSHRKPPRLLVAGHGLLNAIGVLLLAWATLFPAG